MLWQSLRERGSQAQSYGSGDIPELDLSPEVLAAVLGIQEIEKHLQTRDHA